MFIVSSSDKVMLTLTDLDLNENIAKKKSQFHNKTIFGFRLFLYLCSWYYNLASPLNKCNFIVFSLNAHESQKSIYSAASHPFFILV